MCCAAPESGVLLNTESRSPAGLWQAEDGFACDPALECSNNVSSVRFRCGAGVCLDVVTHGEDWCAVEMFSDVDERLYLIRPDAKLDSTLVPRVAFSWGL